MPFDRMPAPSFLFAQINRRSPCRVILHELRARLEQVVGCCVRQNARIVAAGGAIIVTRARAALRSFEDGTASVPQQEGSSRPNFRVVGGTDG